MSKTVSGIRDIVAGGGGSEHTTALVQTRQRPPALNRKAPSGHAASAQRPSGAFIRPIVMPARAYAKYERRG